GKAPGDPPAGAPGPSGTATAATSGSPPAFPPGPATPGTRQQQAAQDIASALNGGRPAASPAVADILLISLLTSMAAPS
ncbi:MAG: hypothetical protein ACRDYY_13800, partial [Acidimicrobiales bacterium]